MVDDIRAAAERSIAEERAAAKARLMSTQVLADGSILALCRSCPPKTFDVRRRGQRVFSSGFRAADMERIGEWWEAHRCTELHEYYLNPVTRPLSFEELSRAQRFGLSVDPVVVPFRYAEKFK